MSSQDSRFKYEKSAKVALSAEELFQYHTNIFNICQMIPSYIKIRVIEGSEHLVSGNTVRLQVNISGFSFLWESVLEDYKKNEYFSDRMIKGPFKSWHHLHLFQQTDHGTILTDQIDYDIPLGIFGSVVEKFLVRNIINKIFTIRYNFDIGKSQNSCLI